MSDKKSDLKALIASKDGYAHFGGRRFYIASGVREYFAEKSQRHWIKEGRKEVVEWIKSHPLIEPDDDSITRFEPFYQIEESKLEEWGINE